MNTPSTPNARESENQAVSSYHLRMMGFARMRDEAAKVLLDLAMVMLPEEYLGLAPSTLDPAVHPVYAHYYRLLALYMRTDWIGMSISQSQEVKEAFAQGLNIVNSIMLNAYHPHQEDVNHDEYYACSRAYRQALESLPCSLAQWELVRKMLYSLGTTGSFREASMASVLQDPMFYQRVFQTTAGLFLTGLTPECLAVKTKVCEPFLTEVIPQDDGAIYRHLQYRTVSGISLFSRRFLMTDDWFYVVDDL